MVTVPVGALIVIVSKGVSKGAHASVGLLKAWQMVPEEQQQSGPSWEYQLLRWDLRFALEKGIWLQRGGQSYSGHQQGTLGLSCGLHKMSSMYHR